MRSLLEFLFVDHAILRIFWHNLSEFSPNVWRSNHPTHSRLKNLQKQGLKHVLNLRGDLNGSHYKFVSTSCQKLGLEFTNIGLAARDIVAKERYVGVLDFFDKTNDPFLIHCKSGADRTGLAAAFYLIYKKGQSVAQARAQLSPRFLHFKNTKTGILDHILDCYETYLIEHPKSNLRHWLETEFDPIAIKSSFNETRAKRGKSLMK